jgi:hypothetical protein
VSVARRALGLVLAGGAAGYTLRVTRTAGAPRPAVTVAPTTPVPAGGCRCGCVALRVRMAHLEQQVAYWRTEAQR